MNRYLTMLARLLRQIAGLFPTAIPQGVTEFNAWSESIINTYNIQADPDSIKFALATMILHSGPTTAYKPKFSYFLMIRAGMAKQVAGAVFQDIKTKQQERIKAEQLAAQTPTTAVVPASTTVSSVQPLQN